MAVMATATAFGRRNQKRLPLPGVLSTPIAATAKWRLVLR